MIAMPPAEKPSLAAKAKTPRPQLRERMLRKASSVSTDTPTGRLANLFSTGLTLFPTSLVPGYTFPTPARPLIPATRKERNALWLRFKHKLDFVVCRSDLSRAIKTLAPLDYPAMLVKLTHSCTSFPAVRDYIKNTTLSDREEIINHYLDLFFFLDHFRDENREIKIGGGQGTTTSIIQEWLNRETIDRSRLIPASSPIFRVLFQQVQAIAGYLASRTIQTFSQYTLRMEVEALKRDARRVRILSPEPFREEDYVPWQTRTIEDWELLVPTS
jgi:hypothetical protein